MWPKVIATAPPASGTNRRRIAPTSGPCTSSTPSTSRWRRETSYTDGQLQQLRDLLQRAATTAPAYVMFNNLPRVGDAKRFVRMLG